MWNSPELQQEAQRVESWDYSKQLVEIENKINDLQDNSTENDQSAKEELNILLSNVFLDNFVSSLDDGKKRNLQSSIGEILNKHKNDENFSTEYKGLISLWKKLWIDLKIFEGDNRGLESFPKISRKWELEWIEKWEDGKRETITWKLERNKPEEWKDGPEEWLRLYETIEKIDVQLETVKNLLNNDKLKNDPDVKWLKKLLETFQDVIWNTTRNNVKILQEFISNNLDGIYKEEFDRLSKKSNSFDGLFWKGTLAWLNIVLEKTWKYINDMEEYIQNLEYNENYEKLKKIKAKENVKIKKWSIIDPKELLDWLDWLDWVDLNIDYDNSSSFNTGVSGKYTIEIIAKLWDAEHWVPVEVEVVDKVDEADVNSSLNTTDPLAIGDNKYQVMENSNAIASNARLNWVIFYTVNMFQGEQPGEWKKWECAKPSPNWDYECYMKLRNGELYKVKVDTDWNLCPLAIQISNKLNFKEGSDAKIQVLLSNIPSCMKYLYNKLPSAIQNPNEITIWWSSTLNDYTLTSYWRTLTIEPMTIAWDWICKNENNPYYLSKSLAFLNLTNYIRSEWASNGKIDLDVNSELKIRWARGKDGKKLYIDKSAFWLDNATPEELSRFKRYNNHEQWEDNWDKKWPNKVYEKTDISSKLAWAEAVLTWTASNQLAAKWWE